MGTQLVNESDTSKRWQNHEHNGRLWTGLFFIIVGGVALARSFMVPMPDWLFTWQTLLITIGLFIGVRNHFHGATWLILILIGGAFLLNDFYFRGDLRNHIWPVVIIALGAVFILRPRRRRSRQWFEGSWQNKNIETTNETGDYTDLTIVFGSSKKKIESKTFKGGDITSVFGGAELDLSNADIQGEVILDITTVFGGVELIIPSNWTIKSDVVSILGSVKDMRVQSATLVEDPQKVIVLDGTALMGGIEIRSFKK